MEFSVPRSHLPDDKMKRREILDSYFPWGLVPFEKLSGDNWQISTFPASASEFLVDPHLETALSQWIEPITVEEVRAYKRFYKNAMISFHDSWSLYYWSLLLSWMGETGNFPRHLTIIHVDDHSDLMSPSLLVNENQKTYVNIFNQKDVDLSRPDSVKDGILDHGIDIGSFIMPLIFYIDSVDVLHLRYAHLGEMVERQLICSLENDRLLAQENKRLAIKEASQRSNHRYFLSSDLGKLLEKVPENGIVLLHIDCDALNNRYNGSTHWTQSTSSIDLSFNQIVKKLDELFEALSRLSHTFYTNLAISPNFFPGELWNPVTDYIIRNCLEKKMITDDDFAKYLMHHCKEDVLEDFNFPNQISSSKSLNMCNMIRG